MMMKRMKGNWKIHWKTIPKWSRTHCFFFPHRWQFGSVETKKKHANPFQTASILYWFEYHDETPILIGNHFRTHRWNKQCDTASSNLCALRKVKSFAIAEIIRWKSNCFFCGEFSLISLLHKYGQESFGQPIKYINNIFSCTENAFLSTEIFNKQSIWQCCVVLSLSDHFDIVVT